MLTQSFAHFMEKVNIHLESLCGMTADDLPDYCYYVAWEDHVSPLITARDALRNAQDH